MARTLVISDLHIGARGARSVLESQEPLERLLDELGSCQRLVLLGDIVELIATRPLTALARARPILTAIGARLGLDKEIVIVPGNHDRPLVRSWVRTQGADLDIAATVPPDASEALSLLVAQFSPAQVTVSYPGAWLADGVWATHGHYLDRHLIPVSNYGWLPGRRGRRPSDDARPVEYERGRRMPVRSLVRWLPAPAATAARSLAELARATTMPAIRDGVFDPRIAPLTSRLLSRQMRRHALPAMARVVRRLEVEASWVVFGHVHRLGPLAGDEVDGWRSTDGRTGLLNTGSWLYEPRLVHRAAPPHPYWPGGAVVIENGRAPRAIGLLDDVPEERLL